MATLAILISLSSGLSNSILKHGLSNSIQKHGVSEQCIVSNNVLQQGLAYNELQHALSNVITLRNILKQFGVFNTEDLRNTIMYIRLGHVVIISIKWLGQSSPVMVRVTLIICLKGHKCTDLEWKMRRT